MSEKNQLLESISKTIHTYREGELPVPTPDHVERWASQFTRVDEIPFLREFDHVIRQTFLTKEIVGKFLAGLVFNKFLAGDDPRAFWAGTNFLQIQSDGQSQREMVQRFAEILRDQCGLELAKCGGDTGVFIYLDDVLFSGRRVETDLQRWIAIEAPANAIVHVILIAFHTSGHYYITSTGLKRAIADSGKNIKIKFWRLVELKNQKSQKNSSDVLWPSAVPEDDAVQQYVASEQRFPLALRAPGGPLGFFSSEDGRALLEREFLTAGVRIRSLTQTPRNHVRPLGFGSFGVGFGSLVATYRNCPNNCPLAVWWGDAKATSGALCWYPLLPRKTYSDPENIFSAFKSLTT